MVYAYDLNIQYPVKDLYDNLIIAMSIAAAKDMYEKGQLEIKDFLKEYGDFLSPFAKDMQRYNQIVGGVKDVINNLYANGIDPIRSAEGRAAVSRAIASVDPTELNAMKANAKTGYAYLEAMQKLRQTGKYSQALEDFDMALTGTTPFDQFATNNGQGGFNSWNRISPILATTLRDLTHGSYEGRTARTLTKEDFINDPRLKGIAFDPRYEYSGYVDSDLMKVAPGASASLAGDPRALFFRDLARQKVIAAGKEPTEGNVEAQFQRDIADANTWALIDPSRKVDEFAKMELAYRQQAALQAQDHRNKMKEIREGRTQSNETGASGSYANVINNAASAMKEAQKLRLILDSPSAQREYNRINSMTDPKKREIAERNFNGALMKSWLVKKRDDGKTLFLRLMDVGPGLAGRNELNKILDSRAVGGSLNLDNDQILGTNLEKLDDGWFNVKNSDYKVLSAHEMMARILKNESGNGFTITDTNHKKYGVNDIVKHLESTAKNSTYPWYHSESGRGARAEKIKPSTSKNRYIVGYNDNGERVVYMKAKVSYDANWNPFNNEAENMWVELPIKQLPIGTPSVESSPFFYGAENSERKQYSNAAVNQSYEDVRW